MGARAAVMGIRIPAGLPVPEFDQRHYLSFIPAVVRQDRHRISLILAFLAGCRDQRHLGGQIFTDYIVGLSVDLDLAPFVEGFACSLDTGIDIKCANPLIICSRSGPVVDTVCCPYRLIDTFGNLLSSFLIKIV